MWSSLLLFIKYDYKQKNPKDEHFFQSVYLSGHSSDTTFETALGTYFVFFPRY